MAFRWPDEKAGTATKTLKKCNTEMNQIGGLLLYVSKLFLKEKK